MKNLICFLIIVFNCSLFSQINEESNFLTFFRMGFYGGINFNSSSEPGGALIIEGTTNLTSNLNLKISTGYYKSFKSESYTVKSYNSGTIEGEKIYFAGQYDVTEKGYDIFPLSLGLQYNFNYKTISPYLLANISYNLISAKVYTSPGENWSYKSFDEVPEDFKTKHIETLPTNSSSLTFGLGVIYNLSPGLDLDLRYLYRIDTEIINSNQIVIGIWL